MNLLPIQRIIERLTDNNLPKNDNITIDKRYRNILYIKIYQLNTISFSVLLCNVLDIRIHIVNCESSIHISNCPFLTSINITYSGDKEHIGIITIGEELPLLENLYVSSCNLYIKDKVYPSLDDLNLNDTKLLQCNYNKLPNLKFLELSNCQLPKDNLVLYNELLSFTLQNTKVDTLKIISGNSLKTLIFYFFDKDDFPDIEILNVLYNLDFFSFIVKDYTLPLNLPLPLLINHKFKLVINSGYNYDVELQNFIDTLKRKDLIHVINL